MNIIEFVNQNEVVINLILNIITGAIGVSMIVMSGFIARDVIKYRERR